MAQVQSSVELVLFFLLFFALVMIRDADLIELLTFGKEQLAVDFNPPHCLNFVQATLSYMVYIAFLYTARQCKFIVI